ncbi:MAG: hypothetical protein JNK94_07560 [Hyphomonadaceae bacterium]|nr:hypothetical protein [Hyphomonadaceae bacterium]MBX3510568.1 hypothetical protein [Hyphomonadaceae bacterium]
MLRPVQIFALTCALFAGAAALAQQPRPPATALAAAVAATQAARADYAFDVQLSSSKLNWRARFHPGASPRLRLIEPSQLEGESQQAFARMGETMEGVSWCAGEGMGRISGLRLVREDAAAATFAFQPTAESLRGGQARRFADRLRGEVTLLKADPDITAVRMFAPAPFSPMPLTRIDTLNIAIRCDLAPNGRRYAAETVIDMRGSALGQSFSERTVQRASNLSLP